MKLSINTKIYFLLIVLGFLGAIVGITSKIVLQEISPITMVFSRYFIAMIILLPWLGVLKGKSIADLLLLFMMSLGLVGNIILFGIGVNYTNVSSAQTMYMALPLITLILSYFILKEPIKKDKLIGIMLGLTGVFLIFILPKITDGSLNSGTLLGNSIVFLAVLSCVTYYVYSKKYKKFSSIELTIGSTISIFFVTGFLAFIEFILYGNLYTDLTAKGISNLGLMSLGGTVLFYFLYQKLLKITSATTASFSMYYLVIFSVLGSSLILDEKIGALFIVGTILAMFGVYMANKSEQ